MNIKIFQQKLKDNNLKLVEFAKIIRSSEACIHRWNRLNKYPYYVNFYFENIELKKKIIKLNSLIVSRVSIKVNESNK